MGMRLCTKKRNGRPKPQLKRLLSFGFDQCRPQLFSTTAGQFVRMNGILIDPCKLALVETERAVHPALQEEISCQLAPNPEVLPAGAADDWRVPDTFSGIAR